MLGLCPTGKLVSFQCTSNARLAKTREMANMMCRAASSMIAVGLSWRMAIGACVLGNFVMGLVITTNGRMGATVSTLLYHQEMD